MKDYSHNHEYIDGIIMDPPRAGSTKEFIVNATRLKPRSIVYISCDPHTQARDLKEFIRFGYTCHDVYLYDMFPFTEHTESVILLQKNN